MMIVAYAAREAGVPTQKSNPMHLQEEEEEERKRENGGSDQLFSGSRDGAEECVFFTSKRSSKQSSFYGFLTKSPDCIQIRPLFPPKFTIIFECDVTEETFQGQRPIMRRVKEEERDRYDCRRRDSVQWLTHIAP